MNPLQSPPDLKTFFAPNSVALVGATEDLGRFAGRVLMRMMDFGYQGRVDPVNPRFEQVRGMRCYRNVRDLPEAPDHVGIVVPADRVLGILEDCAARGARFATVYTGGFAESGTPEGRAMQAAIAALARSSGMRIMGPNCNGLVNFVDGFAMTTSATIAGPRKPAGNIGVVSQSGGAGQVNVMWRAQELGLGISYQVSCGNSADLNLLDFMHFMIEDAASDVVMVLAENIPDGARLFEVARLAAEREKPIVMVKLGRTDAGTHAAASHTGAMAGSDSVFLDFLAARAARYPSFRLWMRAEATGLIEESGRVVGVEAMTSEGRREIRADLVVGADGRHSSVRERAGLEVRELGAPMDVLWFRLSRRPDDPAATMGRFGGGRIFVLIERGTYWQCGYVIAKGTIDEIRRQGIEAFRESVARVVPFPRDRVGELRGWEDVSLLTVRVDRLSRWYRPGLLCIGDAAHAMSPVGGIGINLALQDAVAAANLLTAPLKQGRLTVEDLRRVQRRREVPTRVTQWLQVQAQKRVIAPVLGGAAPSRPPLALRLLRRFAVLRRIPARLIGIGVRPEHVKMPAVRA